MKGAVQGLAFDIRRFATHDGAGIRTTVFLKGCPLRCAWCQNPEGIAFKPELRHFAQRCIGCGRCLTVKDGATAFVDGRLAFNAKKAVHIREYEDVCPTAALRMDSRWYSLEEMIAQLLRDRPFFRHGGGVTLSGGEPFWQKEFTVALLQALKDMGVHTAVESSLAVDGEVVEKALPYIDTLFADFKIADSLAHKKATGAGNEAIKKNLAMVLRSPYRDRVVVRTPLIPTFTATEENLTAIGGQLIAWYEDVQYELLNYNPLAKAKYVHMPYEYCFRENPPLYNKEQMEAFRSIVRAAGVRRLIVEV